ncbi:MAG: pentapeptide repeat-containing protein [Cyanobacteria bacterium]|nr:pentapeptide repeat-containing protein [Cyanobacteriota bacterium]MDW8200253.1 pentapeptide repeat-containing protein [Cyanobacteriota bacterium SKYGB_h_bin112]
MQLKDFLNRYRQGERDFAHIDLREANLSGVNLQDIDLTGANLTGANLSWAFLTRATLVGANLRQADLRSCALNNANLTQAVLSGANLTKADLRLANLQSAELDWAILQEADLSLADLQGARLDQANLERAKLNSAKLMDLELMEANLRGASLTGADLSRANLREAHLEEANLREANLAGANLTEVNLTTAYLRQANLQSADLHRVILQGADLSEAQLDNADLSRANLSGAYLLKASCRKTHLPRADLQDAYLLQADLTEANLRGAIMRRADLSGAYLSDTILSEADLSNACLLQCHLIRTSLEGTKMTGCCIYNWRVEEADFSKVDCRYVFTRFNYHAKRAMDRHPVDRDFAPGEMSATYGSSSHLELTLDGEVHWQALLFSLIQIQQESPDVALTINSYEFANGKGTVRLLVNRPINASTLTQRILKLYPEMQQQWKRHQKAILTRMNILVQPHQTSTDPTTLGTAPLPQATTNHTSKLPGQIMQHVQLSLFSQDAQDRAQHSQALVAFLTQQGIKTDEEQRRLIGKVIMKRASLDKTFLDRLLRWERSADQAERTSLVGEAVRSAIAMLWS